MTVLHLIDSLATGGAERQVVELARGLAACPSVTTALAVLSDHIPATARRALQGVEVVSLPRRTKRDPRIVLHLGHLCRRLRPDIIVAWESMCAVYAVPVAKRWGAKLVNSMVLNAPQRIPPWSSIGLRRTLTFPFADAILANSHAGLRAYRAGRKGHVIYNGFAADRLHHSEPRERVRHRHGITRAMVVGMVASFTEKKDQMTLLRAAQEISARRADVAFVLVGDGPRLAECRRYAAAIPNAEIHFLGHQEEVMAIIDCFDIGVLATFTEGMSNAIMEYMALGKPVVATDGGGTVELVVQGETGYLVRPGAADEIAAATLQLLADRDRARQMGEAGRRRITTEFSLERMVSDHLALYRSLFA